MVHVYNYTVYTLFFRIGEFLLDKFKGFIHSWKDMADFENLLEDFNIKNTLLGLFLCLNKIYPKTQLLRETNNEEALFSYT